LVSIGKISGSKGKKGELKFYSDHSLNLPLLVTVYLSQKDRIEEFEVESVVPYKDYQLIKFKGVNSLSQALELVGFEILVPEEALLPLEEGSYYLSQVIGCSVRTKDGCDVGKVEDMLFASSNNLLVVRQGKEEILIPFTQDVCIKVDLEKKEILVDPPEGLLELNEI
jgi:16S rRNA processing protein RimM